MRRTANAISTAALLMAVALGGCGGSGAAGTSTVPAAARTASTAATAAKAPAKPVTIPFESPAIHGGELPALYTCDGSDISPPLSWGAVPSTVFELALFVIGSARTRSGGRSTSIEWTVGGLKPALHGMRAGELPPGAFEQEASAGGRRYSICPARGQTELYTFALYALPLHHRTSAKLRAELLLDNLTSSIPENRAPAVGEFSTTYTRR